MKKIVVLISGQGSNLQALIDACQQGQISAKIVAVFSNKSQAYGLQRAKAAGIAAHALDANAYQDRAGTGAGTHPLSIGGELVCHWSAGDA